MDQKSKMDELWGDLLAQDEAEKKRLKERSNQLKKASKKKKKKKDEGPKTKESKLHLDTDSVVGKNTTVNVVAEHQNHSNDETKELVTRSLSSKSEFGNERTVVSDKNAMSLELPKMCSMDALNSSEETTVDLIPNKEPEPYLASNVSQVKHTIPAPDSVLEPEPDGGFDLSSFPASGTRPQQELEGMTAKSSLPTQGTTGELHTLPPPPPVPAPEQSTPLNQSSKSTTPLAKPNPEDSGTTREGKEQALKTFLEEAESERAMEQAQERFQFIMAAGGFKQCMLRLDQLFEEEKVDLAFIKLLELNIHAAEQNGWKNKQQVFRALFERIQNRLEAKMKGTPSSASEATQDDQTLPPQPSAEVHAPRILHKEVEESSSVAEEKQGRPFDELYVDCSNLAEYLSWEKTASKTEKKNKQKKRRVRQIIKDSIGGLSDSLCRRNWAVADKFAPSELINKVREEVELMKDHFEDSEIWWGKSAELGAQITVPSVRGDQVLWMCGGHQRDLSQFDSTGEQPKDHTVIEPCNPEIKGKTPLARFHHLKKLLKALDLLVIEHLAAAVGPAGMGAVRERTDCMLAEYKDGARFQRHVDNTAGDGRRVTVLCYLTDPETGWDQSKGGALRLDKLDEEDGNSNGCPVDILPMPGRVVIFYAHKTPHEVLPSYAHRLALTVWYYDAVERAAAVRKARGDAAARGPGGGHPRGDQADLRGRRQASNFMKSIVDDSLGSNTAEILQSLKELKNELSESALRILAGITGLPSPESFLNAMEDLTPDGLEQMRAEFGRMGV